MDVRRTPVWRRWMGAIIGMVLLAGLPAARPAAPAAARDTALDAICDVALTPNATRGSFRYATAADVAAIPNASLGDYILDGANTGTTIYISTAPNWNNSFSLGPGKKVLIKGGVYTKIYLDIPQVVGSAASPVIITNYGGRVATPSLTISGARHFKLTGRYDPAQKTGHADFQGWETPQPSYQGQFGIDLRNGWRDTTQSGLVIGGNASDYEIEYVEAGDGGFAGMLLKTNSGSVDMRNVKIHDTYIHDADGEGIYLGSTQTDPQHQFSGLRIADNVIVRSGLNTLQTGQLAADVVIEHNVLALGAINWKNPFQLYQDQAVQLGLRTGGTTFRHNIVIGGGAMLLIAFLTPKTGLPLDATKPLTIENNLFLASQTPQAAYLESRGDTVTPVLVRNNVVGRLGGSYGVVYPARTTPAAIVWAAYNGVVAHMTAHDNVYDTTVMAPFLKQQGTAQLTATNNRLGPVPLPRFRNFMELAPGANYLGIEKWNRAIGEEPDFPAEGTTKGTPIVYGVGSLVMHHGRLYRSRQANNHNHPPQDATDSWWELVRFTSTGGSCVPDDVRLFASDPYALRGIGLTRTVTQRERLYLPQLQR